MGVKVYRLDSTLPRAYIATAAVRAASPGEAVEKLFSPLFRPGQEVIVEEPVSLTPPLSAVSSAEIRVSNPMKLTIDVDSPSDAILVLSDTWYPGWVARVDGAGVPILRVNAAFRGVQVKKGTHRVVFSYEPLSFRIGLVLSILSMLAIGAAWLRAHRNVHG